MVTVNFDPNESKFKSNFLLNFQQKKIYAIHVKTLTVFRFQMGHIYPYSFIHPFIDPPAATQPAIHLFTELWLMSTLWSTRRGTTYPACQKFVRPPYIVVTCRQDVLTVTLFYDCRHDRHHHLSLRHVGPAPSAQDLQVLSPHIWKGIGLDAD